MKTLALVIGNNNYSGQSKLTNAVNDANAIAEIFGKLGFNVIHKTDCNVSDYTELLTAFEKEIPNYDYSLFYFAGHGFQFEGENYLTSIDSQIEYPNKHELERSSIRLAEILEIVKKSTTKVNIIIIDACRKSFERGSSSSYSNLNVPKGSIIAFSTSPNEGANDLGMDGHSIYTGTLLKYLGRELLSVEELFKKVRKTVHNLTDGKQTTWEHTSLINDFYFNSGQMVYSTSIPYEETSVKDKEFTNVGDDYSIIISDLKSCNWHKQNPAIEKFLSYGSEKFDKNQQFVIGRNILQSSGYAHNSTGFIEDIQNKIIRYNTQEGENHILNGILFEIYFDSNGDFRLNNFKKHYYENIFRLRKNKLYTKSFEFITNLLSPYKENLFYIPNEFSEIIDVDVFATPRKTINEWTKEEEEFQVIQKIIACGRNITNEISRYNIIGTNINNLRNVLSNFLLAPEEQINIIETIELKRISIKYQPIEEEEW